MTSRPPVRPSPPRPPQRSDDDAPGFWARWWARPVNKARVIAPFVIFLIYFLFFRD
jgi:hypothetical protein